MVKEQFQKLLISLLACSFITTFCLAQAPALSKPKEAALNVVVIDPGHGGKDPGAKVNGVREKDIVLDICLKVGNYIKKNYPGVKVIYTRSTDIFIPLFKRAQIANKNKADLFISVHANSVGAPSVAGTETFVLGNHRSEDNLEIAKKENSVILLEDNYTTRYEGFDPNSSESYIMFEMVQNEYLEQSLGFAAEVQKQFKERAKRIDRGVKQAGFLVLRETTMPSVLVEVGFISNTREKNYLVSENGKTYLASAIYRSFKQYKEDIEAKSKFNLSVPESPLEEGTGHTPSNTSTKNVVKNNGGLYYSVQLAASSRKLKLVPANFKGEKNVFFKKSGNLYKYYSGKLSDFESAKHEKKRIEKKFPGAFIVAFENNEPVPVKKAIRKKR